MLIITYAVLSFGAFAAEPNCPAAPKAEGPVTTGRKVDVNVRAMAGDPCPDHQAEGSDAQQTELLNAIKIKTLARIDQMIERAQNPDVADLSRKFAEMRVQMAMATARIRLDARRNLVVTPMPGLYHPADSATLAPLNDEEKADFAARVEERRLVANQKFTAGGQPSARDDLMYDLNEEGTKEYMRLVAKDPVLLNINSIEPKAKRDDQPIHRAKDQRARAHAITAAAEAYRSGLATDRAYLARRSTSPPTGAGVGMVYFGSAVVDVIKDKPELCGAFHSLLRKAGVMRRAQISLSWMVSPLEAVCGRPKFTRPSLRSFFPLALGGLPRIGCYLTAMTVGGLVDSLPSADFKRQQLLYGGAPETDAKPSGPALTAELKE